MDDDAEWFIGRMGLFDPESRDPLLVDWRAPLSRAFYTATPLHPDGVEVRSTIGTRGWRVSSVVGEELSLSAAGDTGSMGPSALMAAVSQHRTDRMSDIVATIQGEQDRIIRAELRGTLVVQGGPGTGKTAVALHRAAYVLYEHRDRLSREGVLIVGPNPDFLRYISEVLPSLGEDSVVLTSLHTLLPGVVAQREDERDVAEVKGRLDLAKAVENAVARREIPVRAPFTITLESDQTVVLDSRDLAGLRTRMRRTRKPHNESRPTFERVFRELVARRLLSIAGRSVEVDVDPDDVTDFAEELALDDRLADAIDTLWPIVSPEELISGLLGDEKLLAACAPMLDDRDRVLLVRTADTGWSVSDVPLLDEAAALLGEDPRPAMRARARERAERERELEYAQGVLDLYTDTTTDDDGSEGTGVTAEQLAARQRHDDRATVAERAEGESGWTYGHVIVDEAQELTPLALRALLRRCPSRSFTLVGDINQSSAAHGSDWDTLLRPQLRSYRREELTVNYRTPSEIMDLAARVLAHIDPRQSAPTSIRSAGVGPEIRRVAYDTTVHEIRERAGRFLDESDGTFAIIADAELLPRLRTATEGFPPSALDRVWFGSPRDAKGLEFDEVVLVEPGWRSERGVAESRELYVALTRATQRLTILHSTPLPPELAGV
ncbi:HelD family protein [Labedella gwakjiensis]|nr:AAA family ATPase [Labedella gwakjiensis]RUQ86252.1 helicase [Labedella gwakjiensis]